MNELLQIFLNWWVERPGNIPVGEETLSVPLRQWTEISYVTFLGITLGIITVSIFFCYLTTRRVGIPFIKRWWLFMVLTAIVNGIVVYLYLSGVTIAVEDRAFSLPTSTSFSRSIVALLQTPIYYYLLSGLLCRLLGAILNVGKFHDNQRIPIPRLF